MQVACVPLLRSPLGIAGYALSAKGLCVLRCRLERICRLDFLQEELLRSNRVNQYIRSLLSLVHVPLAEGAA